MGLLSRGLRHSALMIALTGIATASDEPSSQAPLELKPLVVQGEVQRPSAVSFITRHVVSGRQSIPLERSFLAEIVAEVPHLPE